MSQARPLASSGTEEVERLLTVLLRKAGWAATLRSDCESGADAVFERDGIRYFVQAKLSSEGRPDRLIPLWSQAALQALRSPGPARPLAVVAAPVISSAAADRVVEFATRYAPEVAVAVMDFAGLRRFRGEGLEGLDADASGPDHRPRGSAAAPGDLFSDLNQWMLKVLIAPAIPEELLSAPRDRFSNPSQLARAAGVSAMSAHRLVEQLDAEGFLDRSARYVQMMDGERLFARWRAMAARRPRDVPVRVLLGDPGQEAARIAGGADACLALFAAADALGLGLVHGVPAYVYVHGLGGPLHPLPDSIVQARRGEPPDLILRQPLAAQSVFRGAVRRGEVAIADVVQTWLDVSAHPSRGAEQADLIWTRVLRAAVHRDDG